MDTAADVLFRVADLVARQEATETATPTSSASATASSTAGANATNRRPGFYKIVGIVLAITSGLFIGTSFVVKKLGLLKANVKYHEEAGEGYGYLKNAWWWSGMIMMIIGEILNFISYAFCDAILVTPLGALSVVVCTILSWIFLKERLSFVGWVACFLCIVGSVIISLNAPEQSAVSNIQDMQHYVIAPGFLTFAGLIIVGCLFVIFWVAPRYGKKSMMVYITICSLIGGLSVVATQGLGAAIIAQIGGESQFNKWFLYVLFVFVIGTLLTEIIYLNKALNLFNAALVTPTYYVYFTSSTIITSAVLFRGFNGTASQIINVVMGFLTICSGVILLQLAKSSKEVPDSKVLSGELDEIRTVAEVKEPEYEPRADTIRGGAGIIRALSKTRTKKEAEEAIRIHEERMEPIGENEVVEWDGLRRRRTVSTAAGSIRQPRPTRPPLGMSEFPADDDNVSEPDSEVHPGFFGRIGRNITQRRRQAHSPVPMASISSDKSGSETRMYDLPPTLRKVDQDVYDTTEYRPPASSGTHVQWAAERGERNRTDSQSSSLAPPRPPPHSSGSGSSSNRPTDARRQFSFQNVFSRNRSDAGHAAEGTRPTSRGALSFASRASSRGGEYSTGQNTTEEERAGLVHGDSRNQLPKFDEEAEQDSDGWQVTSGSSSSPEVIGRSEASDIGTSGRRQKDLDDDDDDEFDMRPVLTKNPGNDANTGSGRGGTAFV